MSYTAGDHTWALCAYGESPYLEECIQSLRAQTVPSAVLISTSTPSPYIDRIAEKYGIPVYTHEGGGIGRDWNAAYDLTGTGLVTIAHQDDLYEPEYTETMLREVNRAQRPILFFSDYEELRNGERTGENRNLKIKRVMLLPLRSRVFWNSRFVRRRILSLGSPICCPAVTYVKENAGNTIFSTEMKVSLDWDQWEKQSRKKGAFVYSPRHLMLHRVHEGSETTRMIENHIRSDEDLEMFRRFWPEGIARRIARSYARSEQSNDSAVRESREGKDR